MSSRQHSPQPGLHGDKTLSACMLPSKSVSLTLEPLLSLCESLSPQSHPHQACDLILPKPRGLLNKKGGESYQSIFLHRVTQVLELNFHKHITIVQID